MKLLFFCLFSVFFLFVSIVCLFVSVVFVNILHLANKVGKPGLFM